MRTRGRYRLALKFYEHYLFYCAFKADIDASIDYSSGLSDWKVKKYNTGDWEDLVNPTLDIAFWLQMYGGAT